MLGRRDLLISGKTWIKGNDEIAKKMEDVWRTEGQEHADDLRFDKTI